MTFAVRYPHRLPDLRDYGADLALVAPWARKLWTKLERYCHDHRPEAVFSELDPKEKQFWVRCRDTDTGAPALDNENRRIERHTTYVGYFANDLAHGFRGGRSAPGLGRLRNPTGIYARPQRGAGEAW